MSNPAAPAAATVRNARQAAAYIEARIARRLHVAETNADDAAACIAEAARVIDGAMTGRSVAELHAAARIYLDAGKAARDEAADLRTRLDACRV